MDNTLYVGVGRQTITPEVGGPLQGYTPWRNSESLHDDLHLTAYYMEQGSEKAMVVSADLVTVPTDISLKIREMMSKETGVAPDHIILAPTHTHSGPGMSEERNPEYLEKILYPAVPKLAGEAFANRVPAELGIGVTESQVGINRRMIKENGKVVLGQEPLGLYDPTMTAVSFRDYEGKTLGTIVHYGCHNTGSGKNTEITRDWCGVMIDRMDALTGGITCFINGCQGNCGPRLSNGKTTGNIELAMELGGRASQDGMRAWYNIREWRRYPELKVALGEIRLPYGRIASEEDMLKELEELGDPAALTGSPLIYYNGVKRQLELRRSGRAAEFEKDGCLTLPMTLITLGPLAFVPIPYETFSGITMRISRHSPFPYTLCSSNSNGSRGYFPTQDTLCQGGYEVHNFRFPSGYPLADNADQAMVQGALELLRSVK